MERSRLRQTLRIIAAVIVACGLLLFSFWEIRKEITENRVVEYYRRAPYMIAAVLGIACLGGVIVWAFQRLYSTRKRKVTAWAWTAAGLTGILASGWCFYMAYSFFQLEWSEVGRMVVENSHATHVKYLLASWGIVCLAGSLWSFRRLYRTLIPLATRSSDDADTQ